MPRLLHLFCLMGALGWGNGGGERGLRLAEDMGFAFQRARLPRTGGYGRLKVVAAERGNRLGRGNRGGGCGLHLAEDMGFAFQGARLPRTGGYGRLKVVATERGNRLERGMAVEDAET